MKRLLLFAMALTASLSLSAQEDAGDLRRKAAEQAKSGDFTSAVENYSKAIQLQEADSIFEAALYYNAGGTAYKAKNFELASKYFSKCIELDYKLDVAYKFQGASLQSLGDYEALKASMLAATEKYPENVTFKQMLASAYLNISKPKYDEANQIIKDAQSLKGTDVEKYNQEVEKARVVFKEALPNVEEAYKIDSTNKAVIQSLYGIYTNLGMSAKAAEMKAKL
ncbi:MAG: hypothetical protein MJ211_13350 [Bacteroidales bacterium]|nr:hypothetical protein [Bacteroidales bacterium]